MAEPLMCYLIIIVSIRLDLLLLAEIHTYKKLSIMLKDDRQRFFIESE